MRRFKKLICVMLASIVCISTLTGCNLKIDLSGIEGDMGSIEDGDSRLGQDYEWAQKLYDGGFITESTYSTIIKNIKEAERAFYAVVSGAKDLKKKSFSSNSEAVDQVNAVCTQKGFNVRKSAVAWYVRGSTADSAAKHDNEDDACNKYISNFFTYYDWSDESEKKVKEWWHTWVFADGLPDKPARRGEFVQRVQTDYIISDLGYEPVEIVPESVEKEIDEVLEYPIMVLRPDAYQKLGTSNLDSLKDKLQGPLVRARSGTASKSDMSLLNEYFYKPSSDYTLLNIVKTNGGDESSWENMVRDTSWNYNEKVGDKIPSSQGLDIALYQDGAASLMCRLHEFDETAVRNFGDAIDLFNYDNIHKDAKYGKYIAARPNESADFNGAIFLIEYPVQRVDRIRTLSIANGDIPSRHSLALKNAGIGINIMSGGVIKYDVDGKDNFKTSGVYIDCEDMYYTSAFFGDSGGSSFSLFGYTTMKSGFGDLKLRNGKKLEATEKEFTVPQIVLMDYLEATFAPAFYTDSNLVVFGRKIRFMTSGRVAKTTNSMTLSDGTRIYQYEWQCTTKDTGVAKYVDLKGNPGSHEFKISDFADVPALKFETPECRFICPAGKEPGELAPATNVKDMERTIYDLKQVRICSTDEDEEVKPSVMFPGQDIGLEDYNSEINSSALKTRQRFWAIAVRLDFKSTSLIKDWIENNSMDGNSLMWFNSYLEANKFKYKVPLKDVENYFMSHYASEMGQEGVLMIDKETIKDITELYDKEDSQNRNMVIRTTFIVLGWVLMSLSMVLLLLWALDANTDLGLNLLEKATFGHWIAIKYASDIPDGPTGDKSYITGRKVLIRSIILIAVGLLMIRIDVFEIVHLIVVLFGEIASKIEEIIKGIKGE